MDTARQVTIEKLNKIMTDLTTVRQGDSYSQVAERILSVNGKEASAMVLMGVSGMLSEETNGATLKTGQSLLNEALAVRKKSEILKKELDLFARTLLKHERQRSSSGWRQQLGLPLSTALQNTLVR